MRARARARARASGRERSRERERTRESACACVREVIMLTKKGHRREERESQERDAARSRRRKTSDEGENKEAQRGGPGRRTAERGQGTGGRPGRGGRRSGRPRAAEKRPAAAAPQEQGVSSRARQEGSEAGRLHGVAARERGEEWGRRLGGGRARTAPKRWRPEDTQTTRTSLPHPSRCPPLRLPASCAAASMLGSSSCESRNGARWLTCAQVTSSASLHGMPSHVRDATHNAPCFGTSASVTPALVRWGQQQCLALGARALGIDAST